MILAEYIEREALKSQIAENKLMAREPATKRILAMIDDMPTANVAPVVHARWEMKSEDTTPGIYHVKKAFCTRCGKSNKQYRPPYCPHCGAKMDGED